MNLSLIFQSEPEEKLNLTNDMGTNILRQILMYAAEDNWEGFTRLADMDLPWEQPFQVCLSLDESRVEVGDNSLDILTMDENTYYNFLVAALDILPDRYATHIVKKIVENPWTVDTFKKDQKKWWHRESALVEMCLSRNLQDSFSILNEKGLITEEIFYKTVFFKSYRNLRHIAISLLDNDMHNIIEKDVIGTVFKVEKWNNDTAYNMRVNLDALLEDIKDKDYQVKKYFQENLLPACLYNKGELNNVIARKLLAYQIIDVHTNYDTLTSRVNSTGDNIVKRLGMSQEDVEWAYSVRAQRLQDTLDKVKPGKSKNKKKSHKEDSAIEIKIDIDTDGDNTIDNSERPVMKI
jgi:hypothetical protein